MSWNINDDDANIDDLMDYSYEQQVVVPYALNKKENQVVSDAMIRLEQARLYEMLIKHDLFGDMEVNSIALGKVKQELKQYIVGRLEILLGMRSDAPEAQTTQSKEASVVLPFNSSEIEFLKALSFKGTNGNSAKGTTVILTTTNKSATSSNEIPVVKSPVRETPIPMSQPRHELKPKTISKPNIQERLKEQTKTHEEVFVDTQSGYNNDIDTMSIDEIARKDIEAMANRQENTVQVSRARGRPKNVIPMPDVGQVATHLEMQMNQSSGEGSDFLHGLANHFMSKK